MNDLLPLLALETSGDLCSVCVMIEENIFIEQNMRGRHIHSEKLIGMINDVMSESGTVLNQLKGIAVSAGPGSFTGLRIGFSAAKGIAFGAGLPLLPVPTLNAFAFQISGYLPENTTFGIAVGANMEEAYFTKIKKENAGNKILAELSLVEKSNIPVFPGEILFSGISGSGAPYNIPSLDATSISKWAYLFGRDLLTFNYDFLEPNYFKKFIVKAKS